jgi:ABC-type glycerol-3-phosphate transport system substrate-binding protein
MWRVTFLSLVMAAGAVACSGSSGGGGTGSGPVIDSVSLPTTFTVSGDQYTVQGTISFHDDGAQVTQLREQIPAYGVDTKITVPGVEGAGNAQVTLGFQTTSPVASGTVIELDVSILDANGSESNVEAQQITVP